MSLEQCLVEKGGCTLSKTNGGQGEVVTIPIDDKVSYQFLYRLMQKRTHGQVSDYVFELCPCTDNGSVASATQSDTQSILVFWFYLTPNNTFKFKMHASQSFMRTTPYDLMMSSRKMLPGSLVFNQTLQNQLSETTHFSTTQQTTANKFRNLAAASIQN